MPLSLSRAVILSLRRLKHWVLLAGLYWLPVGICGAAEGPSPQTPAAVQQADFGMVLKAQGGSFRNLTLTVTVPGDWPDQQRVRVVKEDLPAGAAISYKTIDDVGRQMVVTIPLLPANREVRAVTTFAVESLTPPRPLAEGAGGLQAAPRRGLNHKVALHLAQSPKIESDDARVRQAAQNAVGDRSAAWEKVEAIHRWVHENIAMAGDMENVQTCMKTLQVRRGVCAELNSLNVAMLRAQGFPSRLVRIPGHCYYEVYLLDGQGRGHWLAGDASRDATITPGKTIAGMILQKGDNVTIIDPVTKRRTKGRFLSDSVVGPPQSAAARLSYQVISPAMKAARQGSEAPGKARPGRDAGEESPSPSGSG
jgi:hypothetical protein